MLSTLHKKITIFVGMTITLIGGALFFWKRQEKLRDNHNESIQNNLSPQFEDAAKKAKKLGGLSHQEQLLLYSLYKQATIGDCKISEPMRIHLQDHAKWVAWNTVKGMSSEDAQLHYVAQINKYSDSDIKEATQSFGVRVSTMQKGEHDTNEQFQQRVNKEGIIQNEVVDQLNEEDKNIFDSLNLDDPNNLQEQLNKLNKNSLNAILNHENEQKIKLIHAAVDQENIDALKILIPFYGEQINVQESVSGMTALHYACLSGNQEIVQLLLQNGANPKIKDYSGTDCYDTIDKENLNWLNV